MLPDICLREGYIPYLTNILILSTVALLITEQTSHKKSPQIFVKEPNVTVDKN